MSLNYIDNVVTKINLKSKNLELTGFQDLKSLIGTFDSQAASITGGSGGLTNLPKNQARGFAAIYNVNEGDEYGIEQVSNTGTSFGAPALRTFTANKTGWYSIGSYTDNVNFIDYLTINPSGYIGINNTGPVNTLDVRGNIFTDSITGINAYFDNLSAGNITFSGIDIPNFEATNITGVTANIENITGTYLNITGIAFINEILVESLTGDIAHFNSFSSNFSSIKLLEANNIDSISLYSSYGIINNFTGDLANIEEIGSRVVNITGEANINLANVDNLTGNIGNFNIFTSNVSTIVSLDTQQLDSLNLYSQYGIINNLTGDIANIELIGSNLLNVTGTASVFNLTGNNANFNILHSVNTELDNLNVINLTGNYAAINSLTGDNANFNILHSVNTELDNLNVINLTGNYAAIDSLTGNSGYINFLQVDSISINSSTGQNAYFNNLQAVNNNLDYITTISITGNTSNFFNYTGEFLNIINTASVNNYTGSSLYSNSGNFNNVFLNNLQATNITGENCYFNNFTTNNISVGNLTGNTGYFNTITTVTAIKVDGTQFFTITSDSRVKTNINDIAVDDCIESIKGIKVKTFNYIPEYLETYNLPDKIIKGVIADELMTTHPDSVKVQSGVQIFGDKVVENIKTVDMSPQIYDLIAVVQNLLSRVNELENTVKVLQSQK